MHTVDDSPQAPDGRHDDGWETDFPRLSGESSAGDTIPDGLDRMRPGPVLGTYLSTVDIERLSGYDRVVVLRAHQRMVSHYQAKLYDGMASICDVFLEKGDDPVDASMSAAAEIRAALHLTHRSADVELSFALELRRRLPRVFEMLQSGELDYRRARTIERGTCHLSTAAAQSVVDRIAESATEMTTGQLQARVRRLCIEADPEEARERYERAVRDRKVVADPTTEGTANLLGLDLAPDRVAAVSRRINAIARSLRGKDESRSMDQLRADVYLDLLQGIDHATTGKGVIHITADLSTLAGLTDHPGDLNGFMPVISDIARQVALDQPEGEWRYTITDTETGQHVHNGVTRRRPTATQRRTIEMRDRSCVFPGCRMPSVDCDIDHTVRYADGGATCPCNNAPGCRHDHRLKDHGWTYERLPNGCYQWTSPLGHTYTTWRAPP